ncbi:hypothetical protein K501DRAFT_328618 [Backusella circina FSU 941]|nr:hypothetical protein K501DRAFT_328618 [Backusella circina FSU 941]
MSGYPTIRNPLLPSPPIQQRRFRKSDLLSNLSISSSAGLKSSISNASLRSFMSQTIHSISHVSSSLRINKRIMPVPPVKSVSIDNFQPHEEPIVHYNGPYHTWESLPEEKLLWIKDEQTAACVRNPLSSYNKSIVLRKPLTRSKTFSSLTKSNKLFKPKAMFYLRVLQVIATDSSKSRLFRCGIQVNDEVCLSSSVISEKTGKHSSIAQFDETFLLLIPHVSDVDSPSHATINIYAQKKSKNIFTSNKGEVLLGKENINISLQSKSKTMERFILNNDNFQLLVVYGTFLSCRSQNMLNNTILFEDYITIYVRTSMIPRWDRFWGILRGVQFELYDFEYKQNRPPLFIIPLDNFISAFYPSEHDGEELKVDIGPRGIALQFTERAIDKEERRWLEDLECRMYLLPETSAAARQWETKFNYIATIYDEVKECESFSDESEQDDESESQIIDAYFDDDDTDSDEEYEDDTDDTDDTDDEDDEDDEDDGLYVPMKLMW